MRYCKEAFLIGCLSAILSGCSLFKSENDLAWETIEKHIANRSKPFMTPLEVSDAFVTVMRSDLESAIPRIISYRDENARDLAASALAHVIESYDEYSAVKAVTLICKQGVSEDEYALVQNAIAQSSSSMSQQTREDVTEIVLEFMQNSASPATKTNFTNILVFVCETEECLQVIKEHNEPLYDDWMRMYNQKPD